MQNNDFHIIDLVSQGAAVEEILKGKPKEEWIEWLSKHGEITEMERNDPAWPPTYLFKSRNGLDCAFVLGNNEFHFVGDHHFFKSRKDD